jgi:hypothetical protein
LLFSVTTQEQVPLRPVVKAQSHVIPAGPDQLSVVWVDHLGVAYRSAKVVALSGKP